MNIECAGAFVLATGWGMEQVFLPQVQCLHVASEPPAMGPTPLKSCPARGDSSVPAPQWQEQATGEMLPDYT